MPVLASAGVGIFARLERFFERLFEAPAGRLGATLQPATLAKRIERAMDTSKSFGESGVLVPNDYELHLNPGDYSQFESYRGSLEDDLAHGVMARARHRQYRLVAKPRVQLLSSPGVPRGEVRVAARLTDAGGAPPPAEPGAPTSSATMVLARKGFEVPPPDSATRAYLLVDTPGATPVTFDLGGPLIAIGRASDNDVIVDDPQVSRHHCQLKLQHGAYGFTDLGSRNGSMVNEEPVREAALGPGDRILIGSTRIEFRVRG